MRRRVHTPKDGESLAPGPVEVVVVGDGGHAEAGVVLGSGVCAIAVPGALVQTAIPLLRQFCCFFILTLHTAHYLNSKISPNDHKLYIYHMSSNTAAGLVFFHV